MTTTPTIEHAEGMLAAIRATHECAEPCTAQTTLGDGKVIQLTCPWGGIDLSVGQDRRIVQTVYADAARAALGRRS